MSDIGWKPLHLLALVSSSVSVTLKPVGLERSIGIISVGFLKFPDSPQWQDEPAMKEWRAWMERLFLPRTSSGVA
jgi:branched-chain amino acid transport system substrate-binding protein